MSHAAKAFESCDRSFKPVFADPKPQKSDGIKFDGRDFRGELRGSDGGYGGYSSGPITPHLNNHHSSFDSISYSESFIFISSFWKLRVKRHLLLDVCVTLQLNSRL